jgi:hypothetical protein
MRLITNSQLYVPPVYRGLETKWQKDFIAVVKDSEKILSWDLSAILSILSFGYVCGNRTLIQDIKRQPWLSKILPDNSVILETIPPHGLFWEAPQNIAKKLKYLLDQEALSACCNYSEIYVLLSGGLDSRIVAGILVSLYRHGRLPVKPKSITWGLENSRDVVYAKMVSDTLGIDNIHINITSNDLIKNIYASANLLGGLVSPIHLHRMLWCKNLDQNALVINGSYGDSVGRAEFSKQHILELDYHRPSNRYELLDENIFLLASDGLISDLESLRARIPNEPKYAVCEIEMQGHYMRGLIGHAMSVINQFCDIYSMFTAPEVFSYMWSLHPSVRSNKVYSYLLREVDSKLLNIPWARNNRAISGRTIGSQPNLNKNYHKYKDWIFDEIYQDICDILEPNWFKNTGIFNSYAIEEIRKKVNSRDPFFRYDLLVWLCTFRLFSSKLVDLEKEIIPTRECCFSFTDNQDTVINNNGIIPKNLIKKIKKKYYHLTFIRKAIKKLLAYIYYPPKFTRNSILIENRSKDINK